MVGLRSDAAWIERVAADPTARRDAYPVPLLPEEVAELESRAREGEQLSLITERYGADHPDEWAGGYLTLDGYVARFTGHLEVHRAALGKLIDPHARLNVELATWSYAALTERIRGIEGDLEWLSRIDAVPAGTGIDVVSNRAVLRLSSANPQAEAVAMSHYGGDGWLRVESDGVGPWTGRLGTVVVTAVDSQGRPVPFLKVTFRSDVASAYLEDGYMTGEDGRVSISDAPATGFTIELQVEGADAPGWQTVATSHVFIAPDIETEITIVVTDPIPPQ